jgi:hypothetical protein
MNILSMIDEIIENDFNVDDEAQSNYLFYFILACIHSHKYADLISENEANEIYQ